MAMIQKRVLNVAVSLCNLTFDHSLPTGIRHDCKSILPYCKMEMKQDKEIVHSLREGGREKMWRGRMMSVQQWLVTEVGSDLSRVF